uniref:Phosphate transport system permease protein PstA n=1 Tax=Candidatus Kentrum sp. MB TaxID=2138164 RepID=A0A450X1R4_9GAMM|nr:MAG: phosphate ABC transporter membrane protein 2, PhoT family [Candidatus Kentron sp. MB]VFK28387.1 MAG: phosphate ABC transporter membrane protein 2, PhoT family [Candidatus Kentron sp. MB]VFK74227.1 MAG: phosphate ABC transporter membrane protein 2, PhoT family [Candidatus Kentron sp. MB]
MNTSKTTAINAAETSAWRARLHKRHRAAERFRLYALCSVWLGLGFVLLLFVNIVSNGYSAFQQTFVRLPIVFDQELLDPKGARDPDVLSRANYGGLIKAALRAQFPEVKTRRDKKMLYGLVSSGAALELRDLVLREPDVIGATRAIWVPADDDLDMLIKGHIDRSTPELARRIKDKQLVWIDKLLEQGAIEKRFNITFFTAGDSREPELAGIRGAIMGSLFTLLITLALSFPLGVATAVYLEEFAPKNRWTDLIEININNLAAVPSVVFGLLGLGVFINFFGVPRSVPLVGGLVLTLMTLPTIIIAGRAALLSVPPSIREAALGVGASRMQALVHHILPLALPGMLTGAIIGMARALGESAPLLMIGMVAFIVDIPSSAMDPATVLPVQVYLWADSPERAFVERTSAAIMVLLAFLIIMNAGAVLLRKRFERRW